MAQATNQIRIRFRGKQPLDVLRSPGSLFLLRELLSHTYRVPPDLLEIRIDDERAVATILTNDKAYRAALTNYSISGVLYLSVRALEQPASLTETVMSPQQATMVNLQDTIEYVHERYLSEGSSMDASIRQIYENALRGVEQDSLRLNGTSLDYSTVSQLSDPLKLITSLTVVDLSGCRLSPEEIILLGPGIKAQERLQKLYLGNNDLGEEGANILLNQVASLPALTVISIEDNQLGPGGALAISQLLLNSPKLERLSIQHNRLGPEGARHIAGVFNYCPSLLFLSLGNNILKEDGARVLATSLPLLKSLTHLFLDRNDFAAEGFADLCPVLSKFVQLEVLDLSYNKPTEAGVSHLTSLITRLPALDTLILDQGCPRLEMIKATVRGGCYVRTT